MAITPDQFVKLVRTEVRKYQAISPGIERVPCNGLILFDSYEGLKHDEGIGVSMQEYIPMSTKKPCHAWLTIGVEYPLELTRNSFDQSAILRSTVPHGAVSYSLRWKDPEDSLKRDFAVYGKVEFDLKEEVVSRVEINTNSERATPAIRNLKFRSLNKGVKTLILSVNQAKNS